MEALEKAYDKACGSPTDIYKHLPKLRELAQEYGAVLECGFRNGESTLAFLLGASNVLSIDTEPCAEGIERIQALLPEGVQWQFKQADSLKYRHTVAHPLVFLDTLHNYEHLTAELEKYSKKATCIAVHDTGKRWEAKTRTRSAIKDFLAKNSDWQEAYHTEECHGLTVIKRSL